MLYALGARACSYFTIDYIVRELPLFVWVDDRGWFYLQYGLTMALGLQSRSSCTPSQVTQWEIEQST